MIYSHANAVRLACARVAVFSVWLVDVAADPFPELAILPPAWFAPHGPWLLSPEALLDALWSVEALSAFKFSTLACVLLALIGAPKPALWAGVAAGMLTLLMSFVRGFGHADHSQVQLLLVTIVLPFLPAWDALSLRRAPRDRPESAYVAAFVALALVFAFPYFMTGIYRVTREGVGIFLGSSLHHFIARDTLMLDDMDFTLGLQLVEWPAARVLLNAGFFAVTIAEIATPWAHLRRRACAAWLLLITPFHLLAPVLMHVLFVHNLALLAVLYVWPLTWPSRLQDSDREKYRTSPIERSS